MKKERKPIEASTLPENGVTVLTELVAVYCQEADSSDSGEFQTLTVKTEDGGGGMYLTIQTERWAIDSPEDFGVILDDFKQRLATVKQISK